MKKDITATQIDEQILDYADAIIELMKIKGFEDKSHEPLNCECVQILIHDEVISVGVACQSVETDKRKKK